MIRRLFYVPFLVRYVTIMESDNMRNEVCMMIIRPEEWIIIPDEDGDGLLKAWVGNGTFGFPIPIATHTVSPEDIALDRDRDFLLCLECAETPEVCLAEEACANDGKHYLMAPESVIPAGLFPLSDDQDFVPSPYIIMKGKVTKTYADPTVLGVDEGDVLFSFSCLGNEYDAILYAELAEGIVIKEGDIVSCAYWVRGWPREVE